MGSYINPPHITKEKFLEAHGRVISQEDAAAFDFAAGYKVLPVVLVDNGPFTAAAIAYNQRELDEFLRPDHRIKYWYLVEKVLLDPYL